MESRFCIKEKLSKCEAIKLIKKLKEIFLNIINSCDCPFQPHNNPFPQSCDKRLVFTDYCKKCTWRNKEYL